MLGPQTPPSVGLFTRRISRVRQPSQVQAIGSCSACNSLSHLVTVALPRSFLGQEFWQSRSPRRLVHIPFGLATMAVRQRTLATRPSIEVVSHKYRPVGGVFAVCGAMVAQFALDIIQTDRHLHLLVHSPRSPSAEVTSAPLMLNRAHLVGGPTHSARPHRPPGISHKSPRALPILVVCNPTAR